ncbi:dipeptide epimerase, partial [candidate division KSB1 bacterium]|nr:dipeptide epimerase [candidate division KSB1 bacterium]
VTGETEHSVLAALNDFAVPVLTGADPLRFVMLLEELKKGISHQYAALAAVDMALFDILGKHSNLPLWKLLGGYRDRIQTSITIGILPEQETIERAKDWIAQGFNCLKLKGGNDVESDIMRVIKVREAVGAEVEIRFDANQGYSLDQARYFIEKTQQAKLQFIEQPTPKHSLDDLHYLVTHSSLPVMADESIITLQDALQLAHTKSANMLNVKLMKIGGIDEAAQIDSVARAAGLEVMIGCMDESALSIAAGLHFALARPNVCYADLDGHIGLLNDPFAGAVSLRDGILFPNDLPGLGYPSLP